MRAAQLTIYYHPELISDLAGERGAPKLKEAVAVKTPAKPQAARADTKLWALLQHAGGGVWGGCVYDVEAIAGKLASGGR